MDKENTAGNTFNHVFRFLVARKNVFYNMKQNLIMHSASIKERKAIFAMMMKIYVSKCSQT